MDMRSHPRLSGIRISVGGAPRIGIGMIFDIFSHGFLKGRGFYQLTLQDLNSPARFHQSVLLKEAVEYLITDKKGIYVDGTLGGGGHSRAILQNLDAQGMVIAFDIDEEAIAYSSKLLQEFSGRIVIKRGNFRHLKELLAEEGISEVNGILLDLGVSSHQLDADYRGFSYRKEGPLDMRMDGSQGKGAFHVVNFYSERQLRRIFYQYGEEEHSRKIAKAIVRERAKSQIGTTQKLAQIVRPLAPQPRVNKTLSRIFQAIRIEVNQELENLAICLEASLSLLTPGARIGVISYHSLEDRIVKSFFRDNADACVCPPGLPQCLCGRKARLKIITPKPIVPSVEDKNSNPRARSAKFRVAEKLCS